MIILYTVNQLSYVDRLIIFLPIHSYEFIRSQAKSLRKHICILIDKVKFRWFFSTWFSFSAS